MKKSKPYIKYRPAFTIVELLVVVVVIGVLAAITIISYTGIQDKATKASLMSDLENASKILAMDQITNITYPSTLEEANGGKGVSASSGTVYEYFPSSTGFCITATKSSTIYRVTNNSTPRQGGCSGLERDKLSIIKWGSSWVVSTGAAPGYSLNGDGNSRAVDTNPWGLSDIVWDVSNQDMASNDDGGWVTNSFPIDSTKMYRFSTFVRRKVVGDGNFYLGTNGYPDTVLNRSNGTLNTNPYFCSKAWWGSNPGQWYLVVGHVWPAGSGTGNAMKDSGIYTLNGAMISSTADFVWQPTTTSSRHRSYLYYSIDVTTNQQWYQPRVDIVDGTEPTINELLNNTF